MRSVVLPALVLGMLVSTAACGGEAHTTVPALGSPAGSPSTPAADAEKAIRTTLDGYAAAIEQAMKRKSGDPLLPYATEAWAQKAAASYRSYLWSKKKTIIGPSKVASAVPSVTGDTATIDACLDSGHAFVVPMGTTSVGNGAAAVGRWRETVKFVNSDGVWKIDDITNTGASC